MKVVIIVVSFVASFCLMSLSCMEDAGSEIDRRTFILIVPDKHENEREIKSHIRSLKIKKLSKLCFYLNSGIRLPVPGSTNKIYKILKSNKDNIYEIKGTRQSLLHFIIEGAGISLLTLLLMLQPKMNIKRESDGNTPLHLACQNGSFDKIDLLIQAGANKRICNKVRERPIDVFLDWGKRYQRLGLINQVDHIKLGKVVQSLKPS